MPDLSHWASFLQNLYSDCCGWEARHFTRPLTCQSEQYLISHGFPVVPECPIPQLGRDLLGSSGPYHD